MLQPWHRRWNGCSTHLWTGGLIPDFSFTHVKMFFDLQAGTLHDSSVVITVRINR